MATILDDAAVNALETKSDNYREHQVQSSVFTPIVVDLSVAGITVGRALLEAVNADAGLRTELGVAGAAMTVEEEKAILERIAYISIVPPGATDLLAYVGAATHKTALAVGSQNYKPSAQVWRNYVAGVNATILEVGFGG